MIKIGPTIIFLLLIFTLAVATSVKAQSVYFLEEVYRSLSQLEDALAAGEIDQEDYEQLLDAMLQGCPDGCSLDTLLSGESRSDQSSGLNRGSAMSYRFRSSFAQKLSGAKGSTRYDRLEIASRNVELKISTEHRSDGEILLRSRSLQYRAGALVLTAGSLNCKPGSGLTVGQSSHHSRLRSRADFGRSLRYPVSDRLNGVMLSASVRGAELTVFGSGLRGEDYNLRSYGAMMEAGNRRLRTGVVVLNQKLNLQVGRVQVMHYIGPYLNLRSENLTLRLESSLGIDASSAHICSAKWRGENGEVGATLFSYGRDYQNLMSGGYAYSDYQSDTIASAGFVYSDKRRGRSGVAANSRLMLSRSSKLNADLVRWHNGAADRECAAIRLALEKGDFIFRRGRLRIACLWEDLDMARKGESRASVSATTTIRVSKSLQLRSFEKVENRLLSSSSRTPFRCGAEGEWRARADYFAICGVEYYDPDMKIGQNSYLNLSVGQRVDHATSSSVATSLRVRYWPQKRQLSNWEIRVSLQMGR